MADLMSDSWKLRYINDRAGIGSRQVDIFTPGLAEEIIREKKRRRRFERAEKNIPFYFINDMVYIWCQFLSVCVALIYFFMFATLLGWTPSIQSFAVNVTGEHGPYNMLEYNGYSMRLGTAVYLFLSIALFVVSWVGLLGGGYMGLRKIVIVALLNHTVLLIGETFAVCYAFSKIPPTCEVATFRKYFTHYFKWYGILAPHNENRGHEAMDKIDELQNALACCGIDSYKDYAKIFSVEGQPDFNVSWYPEEIHSLPGHEYFNLSYYIVNGREVRHMPNSCCTPLWRHSVYCADDLLSGKSGYNEDLAEARLVAQGCVEVVFQTCEQIKYLATYGMMYVLIFRFVIFFISIIVSFALLRMMALIMTKLFSVTRGKVKFIYDYRITKPEEDPYRKAIGEFHYGVVPEGWEEPTKIRFQGRQFTQAIPDQFTVEELDSENPDKDLHEQLKLEQEELKAEEEGERRELYFGLEPPPDVLEAEFLEVMGRVNVRQRKSNLFTRLARLAEQERQEELEAELEAELQLLAALEKQEELNEAETEDVNTSNEQKRKEILSKKLRKERQKKLIQWKSVLQNLHSVSKKASRIKSGNEHSGKTKVKPVASSEGNKLTTVAVRSAEGLTSISSKVDTKDERPEVRQRTKSTKKPLAAHTIQAYLPLTSLDERKPTVKEPKERAKSVRYAQSEPALVSRRKTKMMPEHTSAAYLGGSKSDSLASPSAKSPPGPPKRNPGP